MVAMPPTHLLVAVPMKRLGSEWRAREGGSIEERAAKTSSPLWCTPEYEGRERKRYLSRLIANWLCFPYHFNDITDSTDCKLRRHYSFSVYLLLVARVHANVLIFH